MSETIDLEDSLDDTISKAKDFLSKFYRQDSHETIDKIPEIIDKTPETIDKTESQIIDKTSKNIQIRYRKCGKANCHCKSGKGHGPYRYRLIYDKQTKKQQWIYLGRV